MKKKESLPTRRGFFVLAASAVAAPFAGCSIGGMEELSGPTIVSVPESFSGTQFTLLEDLGYWSSQYLEFFEEADSGWLRPAKNRFYTLGESSGELRQAEDGDEGPQSWLFFPVPGSRLQFAPTGE